MPYFGYSSCLEFLLLFFYSINHDLASGKQGSIEFTKGDNYNVKKGKGGQLVVVGINCTSFELKMHNAPNMVMQVYVT